MNHIHLLMIVCLASCKPVSNDSIVSDLPDKSIRNSVLNVSIVKTLPPSAQIFFESLTGKKHFSSACLETPNRTDDYYKIDERINCFPDHYIRNVLPKAIPKEFTISREIEMTYQRRRGTGGRAGIKMLTIRHKWMGVKIGRHIIALKRRYIFIGEAARDGGWWVPMVSFPASVLGGKSIEAKLRHVLDAKIYTKIRVGVKNSDLNKAEAAISIIPIIGSYNDLRYNNGGLRAGAWLIGDIATLGLASKTKAVVKGSGFVVAATIPIRMGTSLKNIASGNGSFVDYADGFLATVEGSFAIMKVVPLRKILKSGSLKIQPPNLQSAEDIAETLGKNPESLMREGLSIEDARKLGVPDEVLKDMTSGSKVSPNGRIDNDQVKILDEIGSGGEGRVYRVKVNGSNQIMKEFIDPNQLQKNLKELQRLKTKGLPVEEVTVSRDGSKYFMPDRNGIEGEKFFDGAYEAMGVSDEAADALWDRIMVDMSNAGENIHESNFVVFMNGTILDYRIFDPF